MTTDAFEILDTRIGEISEAVRRDIAARLAAGAQITSMRDGVVVVEWINSAGDRVVEPVSEPHAGEARSRIAAFGR